MNSEIFRFFSYLGLIPKTRTWKLISNLNFRSSRSFQLHFFLLIDLWKYESYNWVTVHENIFWSTLLRLALMDFDQTELELYISSKTTYLWPYKLWKRWIDNIDNKDMVSLYSRVLRKWKVIIVYILKMPGIFFFRVNSAH